MRSRLVAWSPLLGALAVVAVVIGIANIGHPYAAGGPPILRLTSAGGAGGENALASDASVRSYAGGPATVSGADGYTLQGQLPDGPGSAAVERWTAALAPDLIERLARALGLSGAAKREGDNWVVRSGTAATLRVSTKAGNPWTYVRDEGAECLGLAMNPYNARDLSTSAGTGAGVAVSCAYAAPASPQAVPPMLTAPPGATMPVAPQPPTPGPSLTAADVRRVADPVFKALGLDSPTYESTPGTPATVTKDPTVAGLRALGAATQVTVDAQGVLSASGWLGGTKEGSNYPIVSAAKAFGQLASLPRPMLAIACPVPHGMPEMTPAPGTPVPVPAPLPTCPAAQPVVIVGAELGLSQQWDDAGPVLVPSWLFTVKGQSEPLPMIAVEPKYLGTPGKTDGGGSTGSGGSSAGGVGSPGTTPSDNPTTTLGSGVADPSAPNGSASTQSLAWDSWTTIDASTLRIRLGAAQSCVTPVQALAKETSTEVYVVVVTTVTPGTPPCGNVPASVDVHLAAPLADRKVFDATSGQLKPPAS